MIQFDNAIGKFKAIILDELYDELGVECWIAGGAVRDHFLGKTKPTSDVDVFFKSAADYDLVSEYLIDAGGAKKFESDNGLKIEYKGVVFDVVKHTFINPQDCINAFDYTVSMFAVDRYKVFYGQSSFIDLAKKQLMINRITKAASSMSRAFRYIQKGFRMCKEEQLKLLLAIHNSSEVAAINNDMLIRGETDRLSPEETSGIFRGID